MGTGGDEIVHRRSGTLRRHEALADEDSIGAMLGVRNQVMGVANTGLGDANTSFRDKRRHSVELSSVDFEGAEVSRIHADDPRARVDGPAHLVSVMDLDEWRHSETARTLDKAHEGLLVECRDDEQHHVSAMSLRLPQLIARDDEILAKHGDVNSRSHGVKVVQTPTESPLLGQDADAVRTTCFVVEGERCGAEDLGEGSPARTRALHLGDHRDSIALEHRVDIARRQNMRSTLLEFLDRNASHSHRKVLANASEDVVKDRHSPNINPVTTRVLAVASPGVSLLSARRFSPAAHP